MRPSISPGSTHRLAAALAFVLFLGCSRESTRVVDEDVGFIRLFLNQADVTEHVPLNAGLTQRIVVNLYAADGRRIMGIDDRFELAFAFDPDSLATATAVNSEPLQKDVTPTASGGTPGTLSVTVSRPERGTVQTFGPFEVLIH